MPHLAVSTVQQHPGLPRQVAAAVADATGPELVGFRLSPFSKFLDATDPETLDLNLYLVDKVRH